MLYIYTPGLKNDGAFPLRGTTRLVSSRLGTAQYGTARLGLALFAFPLQFSTALEWAGLFTCHCAASTSVTPEKPFSFRVTPLSSHWIRSSAINERDVCTSSTDNETLFVVKKGALIQNSCIWSFAGCAYLNLAGLLCFVSQVQWRRQWWFFTANQWSAEFTRHVLVTSTEVVLKKVPGTRYCTQWKTPQKWIVPNRTVPYRAVPCSGKAPLDIIATIIDSTPLD